ncbi:uncharacterized protein LOC144129896 [Amblyomma americanum]
MNSPMDPGMLLPESPKSPGSRKSIRRTRSKHGGPVEKHSPLEKKKLSPGSHKSPDGRGGRKPHRSSSEKMHNAASLPSHKIPRRSTKPPRTPKSPPDAKASSPKSPLSLQVAPASRSRPERISSVNQLITQKGLLYLKSCLNVIKVDNVDNVKRVLAKGGILWPEKNPKPDFLNAILFMSSNVFAPVLLELTIEDNYGRGAYLQWRPTSTYNIRSEELRRLFETRHIRQHLAVSYKAFAGTYNETRLDQLMTNLNGFEEFLKRWKDVVDDLRVFNDSTDILRYTPSVSRKR